MRIAVTIFACVSLAACSLLGQSPTAMSCPQQSSPGSFCEVRETTLPALASLNVDSRANGAISIRGGGRTEILVRAMVRARGNTDSEAKNLAGHVAVDTSAGRVRAEGPAAGNWSVSYEILVPSRTNLLLNAKNGGVSVTGVESSIEFHAVNGGISLRNVGGFVHGETVNGGVSVSLSDKKWSGQGMDASTTNGGVKMNVPEDLCAELDLGTVNGGINMKLPNAPRASGGKLRATLGAGGPQIRIRTQNGGVTVSAPEAVQRRS